MGNLNDPAQAVAWLRTPQAIRERCHALFNLAERDALPNFTLHLDRMAAAADYVAQAIRETYPSLQIPYHARWRHFAANGIDRWGQLAHRLDGLDRDEIARIRFDLCVTSVLLDAGAGPGWTYHEAGHGPVARSEGLAVASLHAFQAGLFSGDKAQPLRADAAGLIPLAPNAIAHAFQVTEANPLVGVEGRAALLRNLGQALRSRPDLFGPQARIGGLYDYLKTQMQDGRLHATAILAAVLEGLGPIWPSRMTLDGVNLGDVWRHRGIVSGDLTSGLIPFHKLSQWLSYSLVEVFEAAGIAVAGLDELTGLPEYRNGGLFLDLGVLALRHEALAKFPIPVEDEAVVEWRALTLALLDRIADPVRLRLGKTAAEMPLARILEGGTWAAGRKIARAKRPDGGPPLTVASDGTVF